MRPILILTIALFGMVGTANSATLSVTPDTFIDVTETVSPDPLNTAEADGDGGLIQTTPGPLAVGDVLGVGGSASMQTRTDDIEISFAQALLDIVAVVEIENTGSTAKSVTFDYEFATLVNYTPLPEPDGYLGQAIDVISTEFTLFFGNDDGLTDLFTFTSLVDSGGASIGPVSGLETFTFEIGAGETVFFGIESLFAASGDGNANGDVSAFATATITEITEIAPVPLPATALLLLGALGGTVAAKRFRAKQKV